MSETIRRPDSPLERFMTRPDDEVAERSVGAVPQREQVVRKDTNPKDSVGVRKSPQSTLSAAFKHYVALAMLEGARKYGRHNYRAAGVQASVYYDAVSRHMDAWWEGQDTDPDSMLPHLVKAAASIAVLFDGIIYGNWTDDRPPRLPEGWLQKCNEHASRIIDKIKDAKPAFTEKGQPNGDDHSA